MADQAFQIRSISLPARSHPAAAQIKEDLRKLRACLVLSTVETVSDGLRRLGDVYDGIEELLRLPCSQQRLAHSNQRKWVEEELDLSLRLLDLSGAIRDGLTSTREHLQEIQFSLPRKTCSDVKSQKSHHYDSTLRSIKKAIANSSRSLKKQMESSNKRAPCSAVDAILAETREILISLLQLASSFLETPRTNQKASRWAFVGELLHTKKVDCDENEIGTREEFLDALSENFFNLESGLESVFRKLIQNRVSLLNILSF